MSTSLKKTPESGSTFLNKLFLALLSSVRHDKNCDYDDMMQLSTKKKEESRNGTISVEESKIPKIKKGEEFVH